MPPTPPINDDWWDTQEIHEVELVTPPGWNEAVRNIWPGGESQKLREVQDFILRHPYSDGPSVEGALDDLDETFSSSSGSASLGLGTVKEDAHPSTPPPPATPAPKKEKEVQLPKLKLRASPEKLGSEDDKSYKIEEHPS